MLKWPRLVFDYKGASLYSIRLEKEARVCHLWLLLDDLRPAVETGVRSWVNFEFLFTLA